jgi:RimJ/RimL family protein N-acetyltransferase
MTFGNIVSVRGTRPATPQRGISTIFPSWRVDEEQACCPRREIMNPDPEFTGEDFLDFKCPYCGALNSFPTSAAGHARECMNCVETFLVPLADGEAARPLPLPVETEKLRLRRFEPGDWQDLLEFRFNEEDDATGWLLTATKARLSEANQTLYLAVAARDTGKVVATLSLRFIDVDFNQAELSLEAAKPGPFPGFQLEALDAAFDFAFRDLHLHRVFAWCLSDVTEMRNLFSEAGMRQEAEFIKNNYFDGAWHSSTWFALLREEYFSQPT